MEEKERERSTDVKIRKSKYNGAPEKIFQSSFLLEISFNLIMKQVFCLFFSYKAAVIFSAPRTIIF